MPQRPAGTQTMNAIELTLAAVAQLYGEREPTLENSSLARWHLPITYALLREMGAPRRMSGSEMWMLTERIVAENDRSLDKETVRMTAALHEDFVRKCVELMAARPAATVAEAMAGNGEASGSMQAASTLNN